MRKKNRTLLDAVKITGCVWAIDSKGGNVEYKITKQQCQDSISGVCSQCGGALEPLETVDNSGDPTFWSGCLKCSRFDNGVDPQVYATAKKLVEDCQYRPYSSCYIEDNDSEELKQYKIESQIGGMCSTVRDVLRIHKEVLKGEQPIVEKKRSQFELR